MKKILIVLLALVALAFTGCTNTDVQVQEEPQHTHSLETYSYSGVGGIAYVTVYCSDCKKVVDLDVLEYDSYRMEQLEKYRLAFVEGRLYVRGEGIHKEIYIKE